MVLKMEYASVRIPKDFDKSVDVLRSRFAQKGIENIPAVLKRYLSDENCPTCNRKMERVEEAYAGVRLIYRCPECGFGKPVVEVGASAKMDDVLAVIGKAIVMGLAIYVLAKILEE